MDDHEPTDQELMEISNEVLEEIVYPDDYYEILNQMGHGHSKMDDFADWDDYYNR